MKFKTTCTLFLAACFLLGIIWYINKQAPRDRTVELGGKVLKMSFEDVQSLSIERGDFRVDCVKRDGGWFIEKPILARADDGQVQRILNFLEMLPRDEIITQEQMEMRALTLKDYKLDPPLARFVLRDMLITKELLIGRHAPLGESVYVKLANKPNVIAVSSSILDVIPGNIELLRDQIIMHGEVARTHRLEIQRPGVGFIQLAQTTDGWMIQQPIVARADSGRIFNMLKAMYSLKVEKFVWDLQVGDKPDAGVSEELYDLVPDKAPARISIWEGRDNIGKELILGKNVDEREKSIYAKQRDVDSVYTVPKAILDIFSITVTDLRDRKLFPLHTQDVKYICLEEGDKKLVLKKMPDAGWMIDEPTQWKADDRIVNDFIGQATALRVDAFEGQKDDLQSFGLATPQYSIQLLSDFPVSIKENSGRKKSNCLLLASLNSDDQKVFAKFYDNNSIYSVPVATVQNIILRMTDPLLYKDRTMLSVPTDDIKRICLMKNGAKQEVFLADTDEWITNESTKQDVSAKAIGNILFHFANMRAIRIESHNSKSLASYGLDHPSVTLTLGLLGDKGIQKTIMLGFLSERDGRYAMIQGQDLVFVLGTTVADQLVQNLYVPRNPKGDDSEVIETELLRSK